LIDYIKGMLKENGFGCIIVECNHIGYKINVPHPLSGKWEEGEEIILYTRLMLKEDGLYLYGFAGVEERNLFNMILSVSGFGPRIALSLLSEFTVSQFYVAVLEENVTTLSKIPGVGRKSSQRLILELKEKLPSTFSIEKGTESESSDLSAKKETLEALSILGFSLGEATNAVEQALNQRGDEANSENLLKDALKFLS